METQKSRIEINIDIDDIHTMMRMRGKCDDFFSKLETYWKNLPGNTTEDKEKIPPSEAGILQGLDVILAHGDKNLIDFLLECTDECHKLISPRVFLDIVNRVKNRLFAIGDERAFYTLRCCARTLTEMQLYPDALQLLIQLLTHVQSPKSHKGYIFHQMGNAFLYQKYWEPAMDYYQNAIQAFNETESYSEIGETYRQIGIVHQEQRQWVQALKNYETAILWMEKNGNHHQLDIIYYRIAMIYESMENIENALFYYKTGLPYCAQNDKHNAILLLKGIARIFPKLLPEQVENLEKELGEKVIKALKEGLL